MRYYNKINLFNFYRSFSVFAVLFMLFSTFSIVISFTKAAGVDKTQSDEEMIDSLNDNTHSFPIGLDGNGDEDEITDDDPDDSPSPQDPIYDTPETDDDDDENIITDYEGDDTEIVDDDIIDDDPADEETGDDDIDYVSDSDDEITDDQPADEEDGDKESNNVDGTNYNLIDTDNNDEFDMVYDSETGTSIPVKRDANGNYYSSKLGKKYTYDPSSGKYTILNSDNSSSKASSSALDYVSPYIIAAVAVFVISVLVYWVYHDQKKLY